MWVEKQIQIEKKEWESLSEQDRKDVDLINKFLLLHEAGDKAENEETIKMSSDKDSNKAWNDLESKFQGRILFVESNPNPDSYKVLNKWETIRKKQREILENKEKAILHNKELLKRLIIDYKEDWLMRDKEPARILEWFLLNYKQENVDKYNDFLKENGSSKEPISDWFLISDKRIEASKKIYEKYDEDQKKLAEQIITKEYHQRINN